MKEASLYDFAFISEITVPSFILYDIVCSRGISCLYDPSQNMARSIVACASSKSSAVVEVVMLRGFLHGSFFQGVVNTSHFFTPEPVLKLIKKDYR